MERIIKEEYVPFIKEVWTRYGYDYYEALTPEGDLKNILTDFSLSNNDIKFLIKTRNHMELWIGLSGMSNNSNLFGEAIKFVKRNLCGFYYVEERRYFRPEEVFKYVGWYMRTTCEAYDVMMGCDLHRDEHIDLYSAMLENIATSFIANDVVNYLEGKEMYKRTPTKKNVDKFLRHGPFAGQIFDREKACYRKVEDFDEYAYYIHTGYWFGDPTKGYKPDAPYKWNPLVPDIEELR